MPTDDVIRKRGCTIVFCCSLCHSVAETSDHLFFGCVFVKSLWLWFSLFQKNVQSPSILEALLAFDQNQSSQLTHVYIAVVVYIISTIWLSRKKLRFDNAMVTLQSAKCLILASVQLIGNLSKGTMRSFIADLSILKAFNVTVHPLKAFSILLVDWIPPPCSWVKCNTMMLLKATLIPRPVVVFFGTPM